MGQRSSLRLARVALCLCTCWLLANFGVQSFVAVPRAAQRPATGLQLPMAEQATGLASVLGMPQVAPSSRKSRFASIGASALCLAIALAGSSLRRRRTVPPAFAAEQVVEQVVLDPNVQYILGADGNALIDPMTHKPIPDDWWNSIIGFQSEVIKGLDGKLREVGVTEAFGWSIVIYTAFLKIALYPLQQGQLKSSSMMQLLQPKVKEIQATFKDNPEAQQKLIGQLYSSMDVNPLGGCAPVLVQLPLFWSLYGVWRRLSAEHFPHYEESWLWVPSLAKPNPDFQLKPDWLWDFKDGIPVIGWHDYTSYLIFPALLVGATLAQQQQAQSKKQEKDDDSSNMLMTVLPWISVYFIGTLSLELPQAVSVYYSTNSALSIAQTAIVKEGLRKEIPGYEEFERTGKFPDSAFESAVVASQTPKTLHEAALQGNVPFIKKLYEEGKLDLDAWDEKQIAPMGYAVACGHRDAVRFFLDNGANIQRLDGQKNTMLHYAAGYGHKEVLKDLLEAGEEIWPKDEWSTLTNTRGQTVLAAARVNRKGGVVDYLNDYLGLEPLKEDMEAAAPKVIDAEVTTAAPAANDDAGRAARAALLAAAGGVARSPKKEAMSARAVD